jgi:hypothetical protein
VSRLYQAQVRQDRIVGVSGYCARPPEARRDKPRVSAFTSANIPKILELKPDLVLSFSDLQADNALIRPPHYGREACCRERCRDRTNTRLVGTQSNGYSEIIAIINR